MRERNAALSDDARQHRDYRSNRGEIPASIRRRYGYPAPYRGRTDDLAAAIAELTRRVEALERCHACIDGSHETPE